MLILLVNNVLTRYFNISIPSVGSDDTCTADDPGFPMSQFLKPFRLHISRNATMVAQQVTKYGYCQ